MTTSLLLLRHPPVAVGAGTCFGRSDVPLADDVAAAADRLRALLPSQVRIVSSPLARCRLLAEALGPCRLDDRLMEMDFGDWEMRSFDAIGRDAIDLWAADPMHFRPPGGESVIDMARRVIAALQDALAGDSSPLLLVSHGGPIRAILGHLLQLPAELWQQQPVPHAALLRLEEQGGLWRRAA
ncbi:alpha-ribazole phosphatase family protein [Uliginosibacterium sp. H1]|uniref:alpha-ribazole phosphatase family protein n=1 Tax=Uliginosibacterium sp. H1 TaxID=3114757 RepID=UPI002E1994BD|nr:alpha-ribazole phosphatase family protein [Uliginosibacterium sp. H1]